MLTDAVPVSLLIKIPHRGKFVVAHKQEGEYLLGFLVFMSCKLQGVKGRDTALDKIDNEGVIKR